MCLPWNYWRLVPSNMFAWSYALEKFAKERYFYCSQLRLLSFSTATSLASYFPSWQEVLEQLWSVMIRGMCLCGSQSIPCRVISLLVTPHRICFLKKIWPFPVTVHSAFYTKVPIIPTPTYWRRNEFWNIWKHKLDCGSFFQ